MRNLVPQRYPRRRLSAQTMLLASKSRGVQCLSESSVARLIHAMGFMEPSACSCSRAAPNPSMQASQYTWNGREPLATPSQLGKPIIGGVASSARIYPTRYQFFHSGRERKLNPLPEKRVNRTEPLGQVGQTNAVIVDTAHQCADLLHIRGHRHIDQCLYFF